MTFNGGFDTDPRDRGRPVILIASALGVSPEVFREAFSHVHPAQAGEQPQEAQVIKNKQELMSRLGPYGVTDGRLNTVSNYYRYNRSRGEMWKNIPATATATIQDGVITGFTITNPGSGYSSPPQISVPGMMGVSATVKISYGTDLNKNGSIEEIALAGQPAKP